MSMRPEEVADRLNSIAYHFEMIGTAFSRGDYAACAEHCAIFRSERARSMARAQAWLDINRARLKAEYPGKTIVIDTDTLEFFIGADRVLEINGKKHVVPAHDVAIEQIPRPLRAGGLQLLSQRL